MKTEKLYVIVRGDLAPGPQAVQATHAAIAFQHQHPTTARNWHAMSNTLALLTVPDE